MVLRPRAVEGVVTSALPQLSGVYGGRRVLITGHTGFKGAWLCTWLASIGAKVTGFALAPERPSMFVSAGLEDICDHVVGDVRDERAVASVIERCEPEVIFHLAAQAIVRVGSADPVGTFSTNVTGTMNVMEAMRRAGSPCAVVIVTSDKCYRPSTRPHTEDDPLGGTDPYSASKAACELLVAAYRASFFPPARVAQHGVAVATARAGNVLGGGDWAQHRIVPDLVRSLEAGAPVVVRNPDHVRPWQHVLEPLSGYLILGGALLGLLPEARPRSEYCEAWNYGPDPREERSVRDLVNAFLERWGTGSWVHEPDGEVAEAPHLRLDSEKARRRLSWSPRWSFSQMVHRTATWYRAYGLGSRGEALRRVTLDQVADYVSAGPPEAARKEASG